MIVLAILRSLIASLLFIALTVILSSITIFLNFFSLPRPWVDRAICFWGESTLKLYGVEVLEKGRENIPKGACLFLFNHTSFFDVFAMAARLSGMRFGAKIELFKIPFFGPAMRLAGVLPISRAHREKVFKVYERAQQQVADGQQFSLAPEGSRNTQEALLPFKAGPFIFAINAGLPIVPVIIKGAAKVYPKNAILPHWRSLKSTVTLEYLPVISVEPYTLATRVQLQQQVFAQMSPHFGSGDKTASEIN